MPLEGTVSASFGILLPADKINGSDAIVVELYARRTIWGDPRRPSVGRSGCVEAPSASSAIPARLPL